MNLIVDQDRYNTKDISGISTNIFVRAENGPGVWESVDIANLTKESLIEWLESEDGLATRTLCLLLGH